ncbi:vicilin-like seed storage protein At2g18540 [Drosophila miranda]|uniref:vicilin-like seed storage protein At2g18540 n=1 Tax=Drosophila miranda TaxID=7229 RepID=UPI00143F6221|nr:vicilin-like seed storage protein At2g18540 [Drosophila miranda]
MGDTQTRRQAYQVEREERRASRSKSPELQLLASPLVSTAGSMGPTVSLVVSPGYTEAESDLELQARGAPDQQTRGAPHQQARGAPDQQTRGAPHQQARAASHRQARGAPDQQAARIPTSATREERSEGGRNGRTETRKEEPSERASKRASTRSTRAAKGEESSARTRGRSTARRGDQRPTSPQVEEPQPTPTENAVKEPQTTQAENAVKEPQATQADIAKNNAAAEARCLAEWHRRIALAAAKEERRQRRVWEDALALAKRLKATQEAEKAAQEAEAERHKREVAHQWRFRGGAAAAGPTVTGAEEELSQRRPPADNAHGQGEHQQQ